MSQRALTELLRGQGAHADPLACVEDISAELAAREVDGFPHSIGQLVFHMNYWMSYDLRRMRGERPKYPEHNAESFPAEHARLAESPQAELERAIEPTNERHQQLAGTLEAVLWQTVAHNSYHVGQIAMIRRALGAWPPKAGGDSW
jgi:uncharacterized damage-inducible protein DinB